MFFSMSAATDRNHGRARQGELGERANRQVCGKRGGT